MVTTTATPQATELVTELRTSTANAAVFYQRLRRYHWHVTGPRFFELHTKFEELYTEWATVVDALAERILALGGEVPATLGEVLETAELADRDGAANADDMVMQVLADLAVMDKRLLKAIAHAETAGDRASTNLLDGIRDQQEQHAWMLRAASAPR